MAIDDIINMMKEREEADRITETAKIGAMKAFIAGADSLKDAEGLVDYSRLKDKPTLDAYVSTVTTSFNTATDELTGVTGGAGLRGRINRNALQETYFGLTSSSMTQMIENQAENLTTTGITSMLLQQTDEAAKHRVNSVYEGLTASKAADVQSYLESQGVNKAKVLSKFDWNKTTGPILTKMLDTYYTKKALTLKDIPKEYHK